MPKMVKCYECERTKPENQMYQLELFDSPFDEAGKTVYLCRHAPKNLYGITVYADSCEDILQDTSWADFRYFSCSWCYRMVCRQSPRNGWHSQVRYVNECEEVCLKCYENELFENGLENEREKLGSGSIPGMFFNDSELLEHGYIKVSDEFVRGHDQAKSLCDSALKAMEQGIKVIFNYESMAIGGGEGYLSIWHKTVVEVAQ